jgi:NitT/TauT family transport system permease protein/taurine transport system permease protein
MAVEQRPPATGNLAPSERIPQPTTVTFGRALRRRAAGIGRLVVPFVVLALVWWGVKVVFDLDDSVLVSPTTVAASIWQLIERGILPDFIGLSLRRLGIATVISLLIAVPIGIALGLDRRVATAFEPFFRFFQAVSGIAWLPLMIVWNGFTDRTIIAIIIYTLAIPVIFNTMVGIKTVPQRYADMCRSLGGGTWHVLRDVYLPGSLPSMLVGFRLGVGYGWRALIAGEMLVAQGGMGDLIFAARTGNQIDRIMAGMIVIGTLYLVLDQLILQPFEDATVAQWGVLRA